MKKLLVVVVGLVAMTLSGCCIFGGKCPFAKEPKAAEKAPAKAAEKAPAK